MKNGTILSVFLSILFIETALKAQDNNDYLKQLEQVYGNEEYFKMQEKFDSHQQSLLIYIFLLFLIAGAIYLYTKKTN